jgi:hypothetical protein
VHGSAAVARQAVKGFRVLFGSPAVTLQPVLVNGAAGVVVTTGGQPVTAMSFVVAGGKIARIDAIADPGRVGRLLPPPAAGSGSGGGQGGQVFDSPRPCVRAGGGLPGEPGEAQRARRAGD